MASACAAACCTVPLTAVPLFQCHHIVPSGSHIYEDETGAVFARLPHGAVQAIPECKVPHGRQAPVRDDERVGIYHEWAAWTAFNYPDGISQFLGTFSVPNAPKSNPQILYTFTGLQSDNWVPQPSEYPAPPSFEFASCARCVVARRLVRGVVRALSFALANVCRSRVFLFVVDLCSRGVQYHPAGA